MPLPPLPKTARRLLPAAALLTLAGAAGALLQNHPWERRLGEQEDGSVLVPSGQRLTPAGRVERLERSRPKGLALSPDGRTVAVLAQSRVAFYALDGTPQGAAGGVDAGPLGLCWAPDGSAVFASLSNGRVARIERSGDGWRTAATLTIDTVGADGEPDVAAGTSGRGAAKGDPQVTGLAMSGDGRRLFVALGIRNAVAVVDPQTGKAERVIPVGVAPYHVRLSPDGRTLAVSCRGGERPAKGREKAAPSAGTRVRVDDKTDAALRGGVSLIDTGTYAVRSFTAGRQPGGLAFSPDGTTLYAASTDDDALLAIDVKGRKVRRAIRLRPEGDPGFGQIPTDVAVSADGDTLYVALGGANAVAVVDADTGRVRGHVPTAWYPLSVAERNGALFVACSKGFGSRAKRERDGVYGVHATVGAVQFLPPDASGRDLERLSREVARNNRWRPAGVAVRAAAPRNGSSPSQPMPVPFRPGQPSVFKHVVYIIKENQSYDFVFGDMPEGNGDPKLCAFGEEVTPNHHALAREFVLLDNTYTSGTNSADGHQWAVSGVANDYIERNYAAHSRSYPYDGGDPLAYSPQGFLWTAAVKAKKSVRVYGEFVNKPRVRNRITGKNGGSWSELWADYKKGMPTYEITSDTDNAALKPHLHPNYIGFPSTVPDQWRADQFIADVDRFEREKKMPALCILLLPNDHTMGTRPGGPTPRAAVADNDLALGRIVERLSKSAFWKDTLILVMEDDSQYGVDHVDGHRTVALCVSPYTRRGAVVHRNYNHLSFLRTMELVLGLPPMNRFDRSALPLTACFTSTPDLRSYIARANRVPLEEANLPASALRGRRRELAEASARLDWSDVDRAGAGTVARAIWEAQRPGQPFPTHAFHPSEDEDEKEEDKD